MRHLRSMGTFRMGTGSPSTMKNNCFRSPRLVGPLNSGAASMQNIYVPFPCRRSNMSTSTLRITRVPWVWRKSLGPNRTSMIQCYMANCLPPSHQSPRSDHAIQTWNDQRTDQGTAFEIRNKIGNALDLSNKSSRSPVSDPPMLHDIIQTPRQAFDHIPESVPRSTDYEPLASCSNQQETLLPPLQSCLPSLRSFFRAIDPNASNVWWPPPRYNSNTFPVIQINSTPFHVRRDTKASIGNSIKFSPPARRGGDVWSGTVNRTISETRTQEDGSLGRGPGRSIGVVHPRMSRILRREFRKKHCFKRNWYVPPT